MSFKGWLQFGGLELFNAERTAAYARSLAPNLAPDCVSCELTTALGDEEYRTPIYDQPDWFDADRPESWRFAGFFPLSVDGIDDDTRVANVVQSIQAGGTVGRVRRNTREIRVTGLLIAADDAALDYGFDWFKSVLDGDPCTGVCDGDDLCFLSSCPDITPGQVDPYSLQLPHPVPLGLGWSTTSGRWNNGVWEAISPPASATGPEFIAPCDDVRYDFVFRPDGEGKTVRVRVIGEDGASVAISPEVVLRRVNWVRNPSFFHGTFGWVATPPATITHEDFTQYATIEVATPIAGQQLLAQTETTVDVNDGELWSARMTLELDPQGIFVENLVPNPAVRTLEGWDPDAVRDTDLFFTDSGSARVNVTTDGGTSLGSMSYSALTQPDLYRVRVQGGLDYTLSAYVNPSQAANARLSFSWYTFDNVGVGIDLGTEQPVPANEWTRISETFTAPDGAETAILVISADAPGGSNVGDRLNVDALMLTEAPLFQYFDGSYPNSRWTGLQHASPSVFEVGNDTVCVQPAVLVDGVTHYGAEVTLEAAIPQEVVVENVPAGATARVPMGVALGTCASGLQGARIQLSKVLLERSATPGPWFDGSSEPPEGYAVRWLGTHNQTPSEMTRTAPISVTAPNGSGGTLRPVIDSVNADELTVTSVTAYSREPADSETLLAPYLRTFRRVSCTDGPRPIEEFSPKRGGAMVRIEFVLTAGVPWKYQLLTPQFEVRPEQNAVVRAVDDCPADEDPGPILDPDCPVPPSPPRAPSVITCVSTVLSYERRVVAIPGDLLAPSQVAVPIIEAQVPTSTAVRQARIRFYPDPLDTGRLSAVDQCAFCGDFVVAYMPGRSTLTLDGMTEEAWISVANGPQQPASHLLYSSDGGPMVWPELRCGTSYLMTVDTAPTSAESIVTAMQLVVRS